MDPELLAHFLAQVQEQGVTNSPEDPEAAENGEHDIEIQLVYHDGDALTLMYGPNSKYKLEGSLLYFREWNYDTKNGFHKDFLIDLSQVRFVHNSNAGDLTYGVVGE